MPTTNLQLVQVGLLALTFAGAGLDIWMYMPQHTWVGSALIGVAVVLTILLGHLEVDEGVGR